MKHILSEKYERFFLIKFWEDIKFVYGFCDDDTSYDYIAHALFCIENRHDFSTEVQQGSIACCLEYVILESAIVEKNRCILYLHKCGYALQKELKGLTQSLVDFTVSNINIELQCCDEKNNTNIEEWETTLKNLEIDSEIIAAQFVIAKFKGMTNIEAYDYIYNNKHATKKSKVEHVSRKLKLANLIAEKHHLAMPDRKNNR